jgi:hypothetical protein
LLRSYYSWKTRDSKPPTPPKMYETVPVSPSRLGFLCRKSSSAGSPPETRLEKTPVPVAPNTFDLKKPANWMELLSLSLEFFQMASFALQRDPYSSSGGEDALAGVPTASPTAGSGSGDDDGSDFWGTDLFEVRYWVIGFLSYLLSF